jgi:hypothetical protein
MSEKMTKSEKSLLLYFETRYVDYLGRVMIEQMNTEDRIIAKEWKDKGYIEYGRIVQKDWNRDGSYSVKLSDRALADAHKLRKERAEQWWDNKGYTRTMDLLEMGEIDE